MIAVGILLGGVAYAQLGRRGARQRRHHRPAVRARRARIRRPGRARRGRRTRADARAAAAGAAAADRGHLPDMRDHARARGRNARRRAGRGSGFAVLARRGVRDARRDRRAGRVVGHIASGLDARRRHPRGVPVRRRADSGDRSDARGNRADDRRGSRRHHAGAPALHRGNGGDPRPAARHRGRSRPGSAAEPRRSRSLPPEPDTSELVVRATHVEAPPILADRLPRRGPRARASGPGARGCARGR